MIYIYIYAISHRMEANVFAQVGSKAWGYWPVWEAFHITSIEIKGGQGDDCDH